MKKKILSFILCVLMGSVSLKLQAEHIVPKVHAKGAALIEQQSGRVLYEKNAYEALPMASTTKIMTCIIALEECDLNDVVTISKRASIAPPVKLHLKVGEKQYLGDLLYALMLESKNDAAVAIAEHISGSVEAFADKMTQKARNIGAKTAVFKTPNGLDAQGHAASAYDMAIIGAYALKNPEFVKIVTTADWHMPSKPLKGSVIHDLQNKNRFFYSYSGANGIKTGFTNKAGHCFVGSAQKNGMQLVGAALGSGWGSNGKTQKYTDVINMMNYGFKNYKCYDLLIPEDYSVTTEVKRGTKQKIILKCDQKVTMPLTEEEKQHITFKTTVPSQLKAPLKAGEAVGELQILCYDEVLKKLPLKVTENVEKEAAFSYFRNWFIKEKE